MPGAGHRSTGKYKRSNYHNGTISLELCSHIKIKTNEGRIIAGVVDCGRKIVIAANPGKRADAQY
jgi:hypothetical protein